MLLAGAAAVPAIVAPAIDGVASAQVRFHVDHILGTSLDVVAMTPDREAAAVAFGAVRSEIARLEGVFGRSPESSISRLNNSSSHTGSPELVEVIAAAEAWRVVTGGAVSARLGMVLDLWRSSQPPAQTRTLRAARLATRARVTFDSRTSTVERPATMTFATDAMAKGYIIDRAVLAARQAAPDLAGIMVDIGGDIGCWGTALHGVWRIGVSSGRRGDDAAPPRMILGLPDLSVATSGRGPRDILVGGGRRSHILSPETGRPVEHVTRATVVAPSAMDADALATAFSVMAPEASLALAGRLPGIEAFIETADGSAHRSGGWDKLLLAETSLLRASAEAPAAGLPWPQGFALSIAYEVPRMQADVYRAPYLAIWITDEKRTLVRTLLLLGNENRWIDSNYVWWRRYGRKMPDIVDAMARPTRQPGRYSAEWDGLDDTGRMVPQGRYLVHVEAAREHGGHSYHFTEIELGAATSSGALPAKDELGPLTLNYGPDT